jgi:putative transposase
MLGFIDTMRAEGHAVESICRVLREQGHQIAARTYRAQRQGVVAARTVTDAQVLGAVREAAWTTVEIGGRARRVLTPEGLYGRRKMTALIRRTTIPDASRGAIDRAMRSLGLSGIRRDKGVRTTIPGKDGIRAGDLLNRDFTAPRPDHTWVMDFTYCRTWAGWVYVAFIVDVYSQRIIAWHAQTSKHVELVMIPLRMGLWERGRQGHTVQPKQLRAHSDAGSQYTAVSHTEKLALDGIAPSIGSVGDAYDNALVETINGLFEAECIRTTVFHDGPFKNLADVEYATAGWSIGTTLVGSTRASATSHPSSSSKPTTRPSTESRNPHRSGRKPGALHRHPSRPTPRPSKPPPAGNPSPPTTESATTPSTNSANSPSEEPENSTTSESATTTPEKPSSSSPTKQP